MSRLNPFTEEAMNELCNELREIAKKEFDVIAGLPADVTFDVVDIADMLNAQSEMRLMLDQALDDAFEISYRIAKNHVLEELSSCKINSAIKRRRHKRR